MACRQSESFDFCRDLETIKFLNSAMEQKCTLSERSEFVHFCSEFRKIQKF